jgi:hypothetical protein
MTIQQAEKLIADIRAWYHSEIHAAADERGGMENLSAHLGYDRLYLYKLLKRNSFSALRRIVNLIHGEDVK